MANYQNEMKDALELAEKKHDEDISQLMVNANNPDTKQALEKYTIDKLRFKEMNLTEHLVHAGVPGAGTFTDTQVGVRDCCCS